MNVTLVYKKILLVALILCTLVDVILCAKDSHSGSSSQELPSEERKTQSSSSSDKGSTKLQLGPSPSSQKIHKRPKISKRVDSKDPREVPTDTDHDNERLQFEPLESPVKRRGKLLQLLEKQKRPKKGKLLGRISKARNFPLRTISTEKGDQQKLKKKLFDDAKIRKKSSPQLRETRAASVISASNDMTSSYDKAIQLDTNLSLGKSSTRSRKSSTKARIEKCMRPTHTSTQGTSHRGNPDDNASSSQANRPTSSGPQPIYRATARMKAVTGVESPRFLDQYRQIKSSPSTKVLKGVSHTGILANPSSQHDFPKLTVNSGRKEGGIFSVFHHPHHIPGQEPYHYMSRPSIDSASDLAQKAKKYPLSFRKHDRSIRNAHTVQTIKDWTHNPRHPKATLAYLMPADNKAKNKRPTVDVDPGKYYGHLVTLSYGPESPPKHSSSSGQQRERDYPSTSSAHRNTAEDDTFAKSLLRSRTPSPDDDGSRKRMRVKREP